MPASRLRRPRPKKRGKVRRYEGTIFRLLPGIFDIAPLLKRRKKQIPHFVRDDTVDSDRHGWGVISRGTCTRTI